MATQILESFGSLQSELEEARSTLRGVDENIKRLIGRDPSEIVGGGGGPIRGQKRAIHQIGRRIQQQNHENDEPPGKRRPNSSVFKRLSDRPSHYEDKEEAVNQSSNKMISKVIVTPKEIPSRQEALAAQNKDEKSKARNRRMFGALLGTLQKFQQEETKLKPKEEKRAQLEKKIEEHEIREKAEIKKERQELFLNRKKKQAEIKMIELKMLRMKEYAIWEEKQKPRMHFIATKCKPHIHYLPRRLNEANKTALEENKKEIEKLIEKRRDAVFEELKVIEERMKRNFNGKTKEEPISATDNVLTTKTEEEADDGDCIDEGERENGVHITVKNEKDDKEISITSEVGSNGQSRGQEEDEEDKVKDELSIDDKEKHTDDGGGNNHKRKDTDKGKEDKEKQNDDGDKEEEEERKEA